VTTDKALPKMSKANLDLSGQRKDIPSTYWTACVGFHAELLQDNPSDRSERVEKS
jgi:hypothetical protein